MGVWLFVALWLVCGYIAFGRDLAYWWYRYPVLQDEDRKREVKGRAVLALMMGPFSLFAGFLTGSFGHGFAWRTSSLRYTKSKH